MKAEEKFDSRLKELGIYDDWCQQGALGRIGVETEDNVIIFVHESDDDRYTECTYPPMRKMAESEDFRKRALQEFMDAGDEKFVRNLIWWYFYNARCPLFPADAYFIWDDYTWQDFEDDVEEDVKSEYQTSDKTEEYCPHCDTSVDLAGELMVQKCPNCGKWIVPCSLCPLTDCAKKCPLERLAIILNGESTDGKY